MNTSIYTDVRNPFYPTADHSIIDCEVLFAGETEWQPYTSSPVDVVPHSVEIYNRCLAGDFGDVAGYEPPNLTEEELRAAMPDLTARQFRLGLLQLGKLNAVATAIELLPEPGRSTARIEWEYATTFSRTNPLIQALIPLVGLTDEAVDTLWPQMAQI